MKTYDLAWTRTGTVLCNEASIEALHFTDVSVNWDCADGSVMVIRQLRYPAKEWIVSRPSDARVCRSFIEVLETAREWHVISADVRATESVYLLDPADARP